MEKLLGYLDLTIVQLRVVEATLAASLEAALVARGHRGLEDAEPIGGHPGVRTLIDEARLATVVELAALPSGAAAAVQELGGVDAISAVALAELISKGSITASQAEAVGSAAELHAVCDGHAPLIAAIRLDAGAVRSEILARRTISAWQSLLATNPAAVPAGSSVDETARLLARRFAAMCPAAALRGRLPAVEETPIAAALLAAAPLAARNPQRFGRRFDTLDLTDIAPGDRPAVEAAWAALDRVVRAYPGLALDAIFDDHATAESIRAKSARDCAVRVRLAVEAGGGPGATIDVLGFDLTAGSAAVDRLDLDELAAPERDRVVATLRDYQRVQNLTGDLDDTAALLQAGFSSAHDVAALPRAAFAAMSDLPPDRVRELWDHARTVALDASLYVGGLVDQMSQGPAMTTAPPSVGDALAQLDGYASLFGNLSFCDCTQCASVLGSAAYFVDLMAFIDRHVRSQLVGRVDHPLDLRTRRPDLWVLPLTCANTSERVPTVDLINELLENELARRAAYAGSWTDRAAIEALVYPALATEIASLRQPFDLSLARLHALLAAAEVPLREVARAVGRLEPHRELGVSIAEYGLIRAMASPTLAELGSVYGLTFTGTIAEVSDVDAAVLADAMAIDRATLGALVTTWLVQQYAPGAAIVPVRRTADSVQYDVEWARGFTADALHHMHTMTRMARYLGWPVARLDRLLRAAGAPTLAGSGFDMAIIARRLTERFGAALTDDDLVALAGVLDAEALDRRFNPRFQVAADGAWPQPLRRFIHPALRTLSTPPPDPAVARLTSGLGVGLAELETVVRYLAPRLDREAGQGFDPDAVDEADRYFVLSAANLSLLTRHVVVARRFGVTLAELGRLLRLAGIAAIDSLLTVGTVADLVETWRASGRTLDELEIATGQAAPTSFDVAAVIAATQRAASDRLLIGDHVFATALGMSEPASIDVIAANPDWFEPRPAGGRWLAASIEVATASITVPPSALVPDGETRRLATVDELRSVLRAHGAEAALVRAVGQATGRSDAEVAALFGLSGSAVTADVVRAVRGDGAVDPLTEVIARTARLAIALRGWDAGSLALLRDAPAKFGPGAWPELAATVDHSVAPWFSLAQTWTLATYARLGATHAEVLRAAVVGFDAGAQWFDADGEAAVAALLGITRSALIGLRGINFTGAGAPAAIAQLAEAAAVAGRLGVDGDVLIAAVSNELGERSRAADAMAHRLESRARTEVALAPRLETAARTLREQRRDALVESLTRASSPRFADAAALSSYVLFDVAAGGCATTSRVIAAIGSLQQYVQRIALGVEQDAFAADDPAHVALNLPDEAAAEWEWRRNYRVWEANRKVFLWPENYLEPTLRDDATPLYRQLEADLAQSDLGEAAILAAYASYLRGVETLATLAVVGAYHDVSGDHDTLHLIGASAQDPPKFFYRSCTDLRASGRDPSKLARWSAWQPIEVAIPSRIVSPVVFQGRLHLFWMTVRTRPVQQFVGGETTFTGYRHTFAMAMTSLLADGTWTAPQTLELPESDGDAGDLFAAGRGVLLDPITSHHARYDDRTRYHFEPIEDYSLGGGHWLGVWAQVTPDGLAVYYRNFRASGLVDLIGRRVVPHTPVTADGGLQLISRDVGHLRCGRPLATPWPIDIFANLAIEQSRVVRISKELSLPERDALATAVDPIHLSSIGTIENDATLLATPGSPEDVILDVHRDVIALQGSATGDDRYLARRLGSTVAATLSRRLFERGIDDVLATARQYELAEAALPLGNLSTLVIDRSGAGALDYDGPFGTYFREIWLHAPIAIATALQAQGRHADARAWFHRVFDPTSSEKIDITGAPPEDVARRQLDRVWRYRELRGLDAARVRAILTDGAALDQYRRDPFNPHAIARRRPTAYQKFVFRRYVENLLDWADQLFAQFTMETVDEARLLYQYVTELLGPRPRRLGDCGDHQPDPRDYERIAPLLGSGGELLIEVENELARRASVLPLPDAPSGPPIVAAGARLARVREAAAWGAPASVPVPSFAGGWKAARTASWAPAKSTAASDGPLGMGGRTFEPGSVPTTATDGFPAALWQQLGLVFCLPANRELSKLWDRVEDRLWKIHHCLDLDGEARELALLAPELDPATRVAAVTLGMRLDELVGDVARDVPPYRFAYLIERAKGYASALAGFGGALLSALERRDSDALTRLRYEQGLALARMTTRQRDLDVQSADESLAAIVRQRESAEYRLDYYTALADGGRSRLELAESAARRGALTLRAAASGLFSAAGIARLIPQIGSAFAMTFGGVQTGGAASEGASSISELASLLDATGTSVGLEASFERRRESWLHQAELARADLASLERQERAAELRAQVARRGLELHLESVTQLEHVMAYERERFTSLALHTRLAALLQRLYRSAYGHALALARLAERAYRFERGDDASGLAGDYWDAAQGGLLAGERLLSDLQGLERRFLETNHRELEIDQPFALSQVDPAALVALRETGTCELEIPEMAFEVAYPGHWKRRLRSVRLTIPCVTGPYVNVGATLELVESKIRLVPGLDSALVSVPPAHGLSIATSTAQNDGGVFEMSFRDERYLPFEGLGAISRWRITLPRIVRPFDYASMTDVVLSLAYSARPDAARRERAETPSASTPGSILHHHTITPTTRIIAMRQDASAAFARLVRSAAATPISFEIADRQLAAVYRGRAVEVVSAALALRVAPDASTAATVLRIDGATVGGFAAVPALGGLATAPITGAFLGQLRGAHTIAIEAAGGLASATPPPGDTAAVDPDRLLDVLLVLELRLAD